MRLSQLINCKSRANRPLFLDSLCANIPKYREYVNESSRHPRMVSLHRQSLPEQALKALAREGGLGLYSHTLQGVGVDLQN